MGASTAGVSALFGVSGFLVEKAFARLLGVDFTPSAAEMALAGGQFFLSLATTLVLLCLPVLFAVALLWGLHSLVLARLWPVAPGWTGLQRLVENPRCLVGAQLLACAWLLLYGVSELADLVPLVQLLSVGDGLLGATPQLLREGDRHFRTATVLAVGSLVLLCGLELWRIRLARALPERAGNRRLAFFLSVPPYLAVLVQLVTLPVGYGMLQLPLTRVYSVRTVSFRDDVAEAALRGKTLRLLVLRQSGTQYSFYCPRGGRTFRDIEETHLLSVVEDERAPLLSLLEGSEWPAGCLSDGRPSSGDRQTADATGGAQ